MSIRVNINGMSLGSATELLIGEVALTVASGDVVALVGPSGAGKTTLLRIIAGLETSYRGSVSIGDRTVRGPKRSVQLVFQERRLLPWRTVRGNVQLAVSAKRSRG